MTPKTFFVSDTHFGHKNICEYSNRPWANVDEMNVGMIRLWNETVNEHDHVYHLGDFAFARTLSDVQDYACQLNGHIHLILGNHDQLLRKEWEKNQSVPDDAWPFESIQEYAEVTIGKQLLVLGHYSFRVWNKSHHGSWNLFGHSHGHLPSPPDMQSMDVGVDATKVYRPITFDEVADFMSHKKWVPPVRRPRTREENLVF